jgi:hypothetical protein
MLAEALAENARLQEAHERLLLQQQQQQQQQHKTATVTGRPEARRDRDRARAADDSAAERRPESALPREARLREVPGGTSHVSGRVRWLLRLANSSVTPHGLDALRSSWQYSGDVFCVRGSGAKHVPGRLVLLRDSALFLSAEEAVQMNFSQVAALALLPWGLPGAFSLHALAERTPPRAKPRRVADDLAADAEDDYVWIERGADECELAGYTPTCMHHFWGFDVVHSPAEQGAASRAAGLDAGCAMVLRAVGESQLLPPGQTNTRAPQPPRQWRRVVVEVFQNERYMSR